MKNSAFCFIVLTSIIAIAAGCSKPDSGASAPAPGQAATTANSADQKPAADASGTAAGGASVADAAITDDPESNKPNDTFKPDSAKVWVELKLSGVNEGDKLKVAFVCDKAKDPKSGKDITNFTIDSYNTTLKAGMEGAQASLSKPNNNFPVGDYHADVYINDKLLKTLPFKVEAAS